MQELLTLAFDDPPETVRVAAEVLARNADAVSRSYAHQALGIVFRESGESKAALSHLRSAIRAAEDSGSDDRVRDVRATYGGALVFAGRTGDGLAQLRRAAEGARPEVAATVRSRLAIVLGILGRREEAIVETRRAVEEIVRLGDRNWEGRARNGLGWEELMSGRVEAAEQEFLAAERILRAESATLERLEAVENLGEAAIARGAVADGLRHLAHAASGYEAVGRPPRFLLVCARANAYLAAGLPAEAERIYSDHVDLGALPDVRRAELHYHRSGARLAAGDVDGAIADADLARRMCRAQDRPWFELRARLVSLRARLESGGTAPVGETRQVAMLLDDEGADEAPLALMIAARLTAGDERRRLLQQGATYRTRANGLVRASAHLAGALERAEVADRAGVLRACASGLDAIDEHRRLMGSSELRALATTHGRELTEIALRHAAHDPRTLLRWSERTRATALAQPAATSDAATIPAALAALRDNGRRLAEARLAAEPTEELERERLRLERAVRAEAHIQSAADTDPQRPASVEEIVAGVGDGCLVELVDVDGVLHVLVVHNGRVRRKIAGTTAEVAELLGPTAMLLRRASRGRATSTADLGRRLQAAILGDAVRLLPDGPLVLAPTARLHGLAWSLLPVLHDRPFGIVPSAGQWLRAKEVRRPRPRRTLLVAGPDLASGGAEVPILKERHPDAVLLDGRAATLTDVLAHLDGADLAHLATHGRFRADSPLFSNLDLADGPLTVHDLERLRRAPYRVVLSACESGVLAPVGAQELLGLAAALFSIGSAGLVSSVAEVNDAATADLMVDLHDGLARGDDPATALLGVRQRAAADPVAAGTAAAFVALGV